MREVDWEDPRMRERMREPIVIPRWLLTAKYFVFALVGAAVYNTNPPAFNRIYETSLTAVWALALILVAVVALVGSIRSVWEVHAEKWGATLIFVLMAIYAFAPIALVLQGDPDRLAYSAIAILVSLLPYARAVQLWGRHA
jgi:hypothetical protein